MERDRTLAEQARELLERVDNYSKEASQGSQEAAMALFYQFVSKGPDHGPEIKMSHELLQTLEREERFALEIARMFCVKANEAIGGSAGHLLDWDNVDLKEFFVNLGQGIQNIIGARKINNYATKIDKLSLAMLFLEQTNYYADQLITWAEKQLA